MKSIIAFLFLVLASSVSYAQNPPCSTLAVEQIVIDTGGKLAVTISNNCMTCNYSGMGCVYGELKVIRTVAPFDTLGASNCMCLAWRNPNVHGKEQTFRVSTSIASVPAAADMRVLMLYCGCDTIPFSKAMLGIENKTTEKGYKLYPNPATGILTVEDGVGNVASIAITDMTGRILMQQKPAGNKTGIDISKLTAGLYIVSLSDKQDVILSTDKIEKR